MAGTLSGIRCSQRSLQIGLLGYGKMGQAVEKAAQARGHNIAAILDRIDHQLETNPCDVFIEFTHPDSAFHNIKQVAERGCNIVVGTTGWYDRLDDVKLFVEQHNIGLLYAPNFSIGIALFLQLLTKAASLIDPFSEYDIGGFEAHHKDKADIPSGTAQSIANTLLDNLTRKTSVCFGCEKKKGSDSIHFPSLRTGSISGDHEVIFDSPWDSITLKHHAKSRESFASGAVLAAEWLHNKKGVYTFNDALNSLHPAHWRTSS